MGTDEFIFTHTNYDVRILKASKKAELENGSKFFHKPLFFVNKTWDLELCKDPVIIQIETVYLRDVKSS